VWCGRAGGLRVASRPRDVVWSVTCWTMEEISVVKMITILLFDKGASVVGSVRVQTRLQTFCIAVIKAAICRQDAWFVWVSSHTLLQLLT
jgi:hypothetical protein